MTEIEYLTEEIADHKADLVKYIADGDAKSVKATIIAIADAEGYLAVEKGADPATVEMGTPVNEGIHNGPGGIYFA